MSTGATIILALGGFYVVFMLWCAVGFRRLQRRSRDGKPTSSADVIVESADPSSGTIAQTIASDAVGLSVVIAARNEVGRIEDCLESVFTSGLSAARFEVLVVDDGSEDGTAELVSRTFARQIESGVLRVLSTGRLGAGKQHALSIGIAAASGHFILTTDADCTVAPGWVDAMSEPLRRGVGVVAGPIACRSAEGDSLFARLQELELAGLVAVGAGSMANGSPTICNSANLGYTVEAYRRWDSDRERSFAPHGRRAAPGADETLVLGAKTFTGAAPEFVLEDSAIVTAHPTRSIPDFIRQRIRWAAMGSRYPGLRVVSVSVLVFAFYVSLLAAPLFGLWLAWLCGLALKFVGDGVLLATATPFFGRRSLLRLLPLGQIVHAPYIVLAAAWGTLAPVRWKDRKLN